VICPLRAAAALAMAALLSAGCGNPGSTQGHDRNASAPQRDALLRATWIAFTK
jgi:hypothetical protein